MVMYKQNHSHLSYSEETVSVMTDLSDDLQMKCNNHLSQAPLNSKIKRVNKNNPALWSFAWGPPV